jgi:sugar/nucleoside kinase (ribokinase family)
LLPFALALQELEVTGRALECGEPARTTASTLQTPAPVERRRHCGGTDEPAEHERLDAAALLFAFHPSDLTIPAVLVCALGDLTLDLSVRLAGPLAVGGDTEAEIRLSPGGQAANVAAWTVALGARARFVGKRGDDLAGRLAAAELEARGVQVLGPAEGRNGIVCALVLPDGERSLAPDRGAAANLKAEEIEIDWLDGCDHLFVSGYALLREPGRSAARRGAELARRAGAMLSVDLSSWSALRAAGVDELRRALLELEPDVVFGNEDEERALGGHIPGVVWILKRGARGCSFDGDERAALPVTHVVDTTGAGDALAAGWIVGGPDLALEAAARCIQQPGAMPVISPSP